MLDKKGNSMAYYNHYNLDELAEEENWYFISDNYQRNYFKNEVTANYYINMSQEEMDHFLFNVKFSIN